MWTYRPQLDGLRSVAVYLVLLYHCHLGAVGGGFVGVDVFFVLSGFLVTSVILEEIGTTGTLSLGGFYARRVRRLLPAAVLVVVVTCALFVLVAGLVWRLEIIGDARAALLYVANWHFLGQADDYFSQGQQPSPFLHFWSLAIEEQFYVFFPVLLLLLSRRARPARVTVLVVSVLMVASLASQLYWMGVDQNHAYYGTDARLYQMLAGALAAILLRSRPDRVRPRAGSAAALVGVAGILLLGSSLLDLSPGWRGVGATVASLALVVGTLAAPGGRVAAALSHPTPVYLGKISYGTYLWHWPVILVLQQLLDVGPLLLAALAVPVSTGLAALSFQVFESPIRRSPALASWHWPVVAGGLAVSLVAALVVVAPVLQSPRRPVVAAASETGAGGARATRGFGSQAVPSGIDWRGLLKDNGHGASCAADDVASCTTVRGSGEKVLLVGDSFANMLAPMFRALAREHDLTLSESIVQGCPWPEDLRDDEQSPSATAQCAAARTSSWYDEALRRIKPDLVVLVMRPRDGSSYWDDRVSSRSGRKDASLDALTLRTMTETVDHLEKLAPRVLMIRSVIGTGDLRPLDCLASATRVGQCEVPFPLDRPPSDSYMQTMATASPQVSTIDLDPIVCPTAPRCLPVLDGRIVWRDHHHLLTTFATAHRAAVWKLVREAGALPGTS
ncbi:MAG: acyltransferase [Marmoricola sp.]|nr:acyltransferase [Marmoricola sp.]